MSLLEEAMTDCQRIYVVKIDDGYGGEKTQIIEGAHIRCAIVLNNSIEAQIAQKQGIKAFYTITTAKDLNLQYRDIIKRLNDGAIFRVTSDSDDKETPDSAGLDMRQVNAEKWELPNE